MPLDGDPFTVIFNTVLVLSLVVWGLVILSRPDPTPEEVNDSEGLYEGDEWMN